MQLFENRPTDSRITGPHEVCQTIVSRFGTGGGNLPIVLDLGGSARYLCTNECELLQGFPKNHTDILWKSAAAPDSPRMKAVGNSMAVNVMRWIGYRIAKT